MFGTTAKVVAAFAAGAVVSGGLAYAAIPADDGTVTGCYTTKAGLLSPQGSLRVVDSAGQCRANEAALTWNQQGQPGPSGPQGLTGPTGPAGPGMSAPHQVSDEFELEPGPEGMESGVSVAACPENEVVISGGYRLSPDLIARMNTSGGPAGNDWRVIARRTAASNTTDTFTVYAVCAAIGS